MSRTGDLEEHALVRREPSGAMVAVRDRSPVLALMDAGNDLAAALGRGDAGEESAEQLVQALERALFAVARNCDRQLGEGRA